MGKDLRSVPEKVSQEIIKEIQETTAGRDEGMKDLGKGNIVDEIVCVKYTYMPTEILLRYEKKTDISENEQKFIKNELSKRIR